MGTELLLGILKKFWNWITRRLYSNVNELNAMELYTSNDLNGKFYAMYILPPPSKQDPPKKLLWDRILWFTLLNPPFRASDLSSFCLWNMPFLHNLNPFSKPAFKNAALGNPAFHWTMNSGSTSWVCVSHLIAHCWSPCLLFHSFPFLTNYSSEEMWKSDMSGRTDDLSHKVYGGLFRELEGCFKGDSLLMSSSQGLSTGTLPFDPYDTITVPLWEMGKLRLRWFAYSHTAGTQQMQDYYSLLFYLLLLFIISTVLMPWLPWFLPFFRLSSEVWGFMKCDEGMAMQQQNLTWTFWAHFQPGWMSVSSRVACLYWQVLYPSLLCHLQACLILQARWSHGIVFNVCLIKIWM